MNPIHVIQPTSMLLVAFGGAFGCMLRFASVQLIARFNPGLFPAGTMFVNVLGSLLIGMVLARYGHEHTVRAFFVSGMLGGFTTFSAFSWDALQLLQRGEYAAATFYILGSVILSLAAVFAGWNLMRAM